MIECLVAIAKMESIVRNARAYGYECGRQGVVRQIFKLSPDNPFRHEHWREIYGLPNTLAWRRYTSAWITQTTPRSS